MKIRRMLTHGSSPTGIAILYRKTFPFIKGKNKIRKLISRKILFVINMLITIIPHQTYAKRVLAQTSMVCTISSIFSNGILPIASVKQDFPINVEQIINLLEANDPFNGRNKLNIVPSMASSLLQSLELLRSSPLLRTSHLHPVCGQPKLPIELTITTHSQVCRFYLLLKAYQLFNLDKKLSPHTLARYEYTHTQYR